MRISTPALLILSFIALGLVGTGCSKMGCTNPYSDNYDPEASEEDGSCVPFSAKFLGEYRVEESCTIGNFGYLMTLNDVASDTSLVINGLGQYKTAIRARVNASALVIPSQTFTEQGVELTLSGDGTLDGQIMTISYTYLFNGKPGGACVLTCTRI